ncbi:hypothetical protein [Paraburkholderia sp. CNPSo 3281]|uniref:hypothetical protein n=1 Tax=Paraburkholderia sp. CNPSo 3281 TaxID=2940933 RepID=UPI0020B8A38B|nr:hypothetical protein [Paraburkholderia sp. CNPSo 3281]MCP3719949.1 hypothetical protein [Paraburkholderia sp. CNPSo 3281]
MYIEATRIIKVGEELLIDYALEIPPKARSDSLSEYTCRCGTRRCHGTMLRPT